jgi:hypothetical protein
MLNDTTRMLLSYEGQRDNCKYHHVRGDIATTRHHEDFELTNR